MARYELVEGSSNKFWEIDVKGSSYSVKWGKIGGSVSMNGKDLGSPAAAQKMADKLIAEKTAKGYVAVGGAKPAAKSAGNKDLEKQILANPNDADAYLVYGDWLQGNGDVHGDLIALQAGKKTKQADKLIEANAATFLGPFAETKPEMFELEWFCGFVKKAKIGWEMLGEDGDGEQCEEQLTAFLKLPALQFVQELEFGCVPGEAEMNSSYLSAALDAVKPPCLRVLLMADTGDWDVSSTSASLPDNKSIPKVEKLHIRGGNIGFGKIDLPALKEFVVESGSLTAADLKALASAKWPNLEFLDIWFGDPRYGQSGGVKEIAPIFAATGLSKLKHLGIKNCPFADEAVGKLLASKILPQLESLDLSMGNLSDRGVDVLVAAKDKLKHLAKIDLGNNALTDASKPKIKGLAKKVEFGERHRPERAVPRDEDNEYSRYVALGE